MAIDRFDVVNGPDDQPVIKMLDDDAYIKRLEKTIERVEEWRREWWGGCWANVEGGGCTPKDLCGWCSLGAAIKGGDIL